MTTPSQMSWQITELLRAANIWHHYLGELWSDGRVAGVYVVSPGIRVPKQVQAAIREVVLNYTPAVYDYKVKFYSQEDLDE